MDAAPNVAVTGANGFVCSHIIPVMLSKGFHVVAVDRAFDAIRQAGWQHSWGSQIAFVESDAAELPGFPADVLIHGAALTASPEESEQSAENNFWANINPLLAMLEWAQRQDIRRAFFLSSSAVYRETQPGAVSETLPTAPLGVYAVAKQTMESLVETLRVTEGRDVVAVRLGNIYGTDEQSSPTRPRISLVGQMLEAALRTRKLTVYRDDPAGDWTFAPDIAHAIIGLLEAPELKYSLYNVASQQVLTPLEMAQVIRRQLPELEIEIKEGTDAAMPALTRRGYLSSQRLREATGFDHWTAFADGIRQAIEYQRRLETPE